MSISNRRFQKCSPNSAGMRWGFGLTALLQLSACAFSQTVQLPTVGSFSLETSVGVPDQGSAYLGSSRSGSSRQDMRGPLNSAYGSSMSAAGASVHTTIIDLDELDRMIRSQTSPKPIAPVLNGLNKDSSKYGKGANAFPIKNAEYEYLAALSHEAKSSPERVSEDTRYYLSLAEGAKQKMHWNAVELYYKLAWQSLPVSRRESVLEALVQARANSEITESLKRKRQKLAK